MAAERSNPGVKKALEELAVEEESHKKKLENIVLNKEMETIASDQKKDFSFSEFLQDIPFSSDMSYDEILRMATKKEENSENLYLSTSKFVKNEELKSLLLFLSKEESIHKERLEKIYESEILKDF